MTVFFLITFSNRNQTQNILRYLHWYHQKLLFRTHRAYADYYVKSSNTRGADLGFSQRRGRIFKEQFSKLSQLFLVQPNWVSELSQSVKKPCFRKNFMDRRQIFEKNKGQKLRFRHFVDSFEHQITFFWRALPFEVKLYRRHRLFKKIFRVSQPRMEVLNQHQRGDSLGGQGVESMRRVYPQP